MTSFKKWLEFRLNTDVKWKRVEIDKIKSDRGISKKMDDLLKKKPKSPKETEDDVN